MLQGESQEQGGIELTDRKAWISGTVWEDPCSRLSGGCRKLSPEQRVGPKLMFSEQGSDLGMPV